MSNDSLIGIYFLIGSMVYAYYVGKKAVPFEWAFFAFFIAVPLWPLFLSWQIGVSKQ